MQSATHLDAPGVALNGLLQLLRVLREHSLLRQATIPAADVPAAPCSSCCSCCDNRAGWHKTAKQHELLLHLTQFAGGISALGQLTIKHLGSKFMKLDEYGLTNVLAQHKGTTAAIAVCA